MEREGKAGYETMNEKKKHRMIMMSVVIVALILIVDQLYLFGIPVGGFLGDLSYLDITGNPDLHHYMVGLALLTCIFLYMKREKMKLSEVF